MKNKTFKLLVVLMALIMAVSVFAACKPDETPEATEAPDVTETPSEIMGADAVTIDELSEFDPLEGVTAKDGNGKDVTADLEVAGEVNTLMAGDYELTYSLKGSDVTVKRVVTVKAVDAVLANGTYNYKFAPADIRHTFMAAAENYLLHNQYAGVPLFANAGFNLYSSRMQLVSETSLPVLGFGVNFSTMAADDSTVIMEDGEAGNAGEYTYRVAVQYGPTVWNHWVYDDSASSDRMADFLGTPYEYIFNESKTGYVLAPSMAAEDPTPIDGRELPGGKVVSNTWQMKIRDDLEWKFNPKTDISYITKTSIDAVDFYDTYKLALEQQWLRAVTGGGDFCGSTNAIVNAQEFVDGTASWEDVGLKLIDDHTIEFQFIDEQSEWNVKYWLSSFVMTPINLEMYEALGEEYGLDELSIAYTGSYYVDYYEADKVLRMMKNELHPDADMYFYTGKTYTIIDDAEMRFQEFVAGKLDAAALPSPHYEEYKNHPGLKRVPGATTFRLMINGTATVEGQKAEFPESEWVPEPILANQDFKMGMFHALDRQKLAEEVMKTSQTQMYLFTDAYLVEAETGIPYRNTPQGQSVGADLSPSTFGYNLDAATAYFDLALDTLVADGVYADGDTITIEFYYFSGSETQELMATYIKDAFEEAFVSEAHNITLTVDIVAKEFPDIYYSHTMVGEFDTAIGGISGSALDAASFLDTYCSDNRSYFTLNWGIDTTQAEITVVYENTDGEVVKELWSFDALQAALNGEIEVVDGMEAPAEEAPAEDDAA